MTKYVIVSNRKGEFFAGTIGGYEPRWTARKEDAILFPSREEAERVARAWGWSGVEMIRLECGPQPA